MAAAGVRPRLRPRSVRVFCIADCRKPAHPAGVRVRLHDCPVRISRGPLRAGAGDGLRTRGDLTDWRGPRRTGLVPIVLLGVVAGVLLAAEPFLLLLLPVRQVHLAAITVPVALPSLGLLRARVVPGLLLRPLFFLPTAVRELLLPGIAALVNPFTLVVELTAICARTQQFFECLRLVKSNPRSDAPPPASEVNVNTRCGPCITPES